MRKHCRRKNVLTKQNTKWEKSRIKKEKQKWKWEAQIFDRMFSNMWLTIIKIRYCNIIYCWTHFSILFISVCTILWLSYYKYEHVFVQLILRWCIFSVVNQGNNFYIYVFIPYLSMFISKDFTPNTFIAQLNGITLS